MSEERSEVERLEGSVVRELCLDYAQFTRVNISEEHGQVSVSWLSKLNLPVCIDRHTNSCHRRTDLHIFRSTLANRKQQVKGKFKPPFFVF